ncbi:MAG: T9SS type A sorting domain-containing protein [Rhodothermales bacterium]
MRNTYFLIFALCCFCALPPNGSNAQTHVETYTLNDWGRGLASSGDYFVVLEINPSVYAKVDDRWVFQQQLLPDSDADRDAIDRFGGSVDIQNTTIVVNAQNAVYVYELVDDSWLKTHRFEIPESALGEYPVLGSNPLDIVIEGNQIVAATNFSNQYYGGGTLTFYERKGTGTSGNALWEYTADFFERGSGFGWDLAISEERLIASAQRLGKVYTYSKFNDIWIPTAHLPLTYFPGRTPLLLENDDLYLIDAIDEKLQIYSLAGLAPSLSAIIPIEPDVLSENKGIAGDIIKVDNTMYISSGRQVLVYKIDGGVPRFSHGIRDPGGITQSYFEFIALSNNTLLTVNNKRIQEFDISRNVIVPAPIAPVDQASNILRENAFLSWSSAHGALSYDVQLWSYSFQREKLLASFSTQDTTASVVLPDYNVKYSWWIRSSTSEGPSNWSPVSSFYTELEPANVSAWESLFGTFGADSTVLALEEDWDDNIYAGGAFLHTGALPISYIARWTGSQWSALGEGVDGPVREMVFNRRIRDLYVVGDFNRAGLLDVQGFARWRGQQNGWDNPLEDAFEGAPTHLSWDYSIGTVGGFYLATYDKTTNNKGRLYRYELSNGFNLPLAETGFWQFADSIAALDALDGQVLIGFDHPSTGAGSPQDCEYTGCVALLNGLQPFALDPDFPTDSLSGINHVAIAFDDYYVAGDFVLSGLDGPISHLGKFDGNEWGRIDAMQNGQVTLLETACKDNCTRFAVSQQLLYVGSSTAPHIGLWNNDAFLIPDGGTNGPVRAAVGSYFAGDFTQAGGIPSANIGLWRGALPVNIEEEIKSIPASHTSSSVYPNPVSQQVHVEFTLSESSSVTLNVYDLLGRIATQVNRGVLLPGEHSQAIDTSNFAAGTYFIVVKKGQDHETIPVSVKH